MQNLQDVSTTDLKKEIARRKQQATEGAKPIPLEEMDFAPLVNMCGAYTFIVDEEGRMDNDTKDYIFEAAMVGVYGRDVFDWINSKVG